MEDLKKFIFPVIAAFVVHGFLISFKFPKHERLKPVLQGNPIRVEINTYSPKTIATKKVQKIETKAQTEAVPKTKPIQKAVQEKPITQPMDVPKKQRKKIIKPHNIKNVVLVEEKNTHSDLQESLRESQQKSSIETLSEKTNDKAVVLQKAAMPMYKKNRQPPYPAMAKRRGYEGKVLLKVLVDAKGFVADIEIKHSSGHHSLDSAAFDTVKNWLFTPASEGDKPVAMWVDVPVEFQLKST